MFDVFASDEVIFYTLHIKEQLAGRKYRVQAKHELPQHFKNACYSMSADYFYPCLIRKEVLFFLWVVHLGALCEILHFIVR